MAWDIAVAGTVCIDDVTTPLGHRRGLQGGSAVYFALVASQRAHVRLLAVVGQDGVDAVRTMLASSSIDLAGLDVVPLPTRRWTAVHDFTRWVTASEDSEEGASAAWVPRVTAAAAAADVLFLGSMAPHQQLAVLSRSSARLVGVDTMVVHIGEDRAHLRSVVEGADVLFVNRAELAAPVAAPEERWRESARGLLGHGRLRAVVVKAGPLGASVVTAEGEIERAAVPVEPVVDPTGAGDSMAAGFLAACAAAERDDVQFFPAALEAGLRSAADCISDFGMAGLLRGAAGHA